MEQKDYYCALMEMIKNKVIQDSDKIIEEKVNLFRNDLKDIRDRSVSEMIHNIRMVNETDNIGNMNIRIEYKV